MALDSRCRVTATIEIEFVSACSNETQCTQPPRGSQRKVSQTLPYDGSVPGKKIGDRTPFKPRSFSLKFEYPDLLAYKITLHKHRL